MMDRRSPVGGMMGTKRTFSALAVLIGTTGIASAQFYRFTDLTPGSPWDQVSAYGISPSGSITGAGYIAATGEIDAFIYQGGTFQNLGTLGYPYGADGIAINDKGQLAATGYGPGFNALLYSNGVAKRIGSIDGGYSEGLSINKTGDIVGRGQNGDGGWQAFSYVGGKFTVINGYIARSINDSDQIAGSTTYNWVYGGYVHQSARAYVLSGSTYTDLGDIGGGQRTNTEPYAINNLGQVTGYSTAADGTIHAFLYSSGSMMDLGTLAPYYTYGVSINDSGQIVGEIETYVGGPVGAFIYSNGTMSNLESVSDSLANGWTGLSVNQINNSGIIVGSGTHNGNATSFVARPYYADQPTSYTLFRGVGISGGLQSLAFIDGDYLVARNGFTLSPSEAPLQVIVNGTSSVANPSNLELTVTAHASTPGLTQSVDLWDYQASAWVSASSQAATTLDSTVVSVPSNASRFVQAGTLAMKARVSWKQTGFTLSSSWRAAVDQIGWNVAP